jgi:hypothetical protein
MLLEINPPQTCQTWKLMIAMPRSLVRCRRVAHASIAVLQLCLLSLRCECVSHTQTRTNAARARSGVDVVRFAGHVCSVSALDSFFHENATTHVVHSVMPSTAVEFHSSQAVQPQESQWPTTFCAIGVGDSPVTDSGRGLADFTEDEPLPVRLRMLKPLSRG